MLNSEIKAKLEHSSIKCANIKCFLPILVSLLGKASISDTLQQTSYKVKQLTRNIMATNKCCKHLTDGSDPIHTVQEPSYAQQTNERTKEKKIIQYSEQWKHELFARGPTFMCAHTMIHQINVLAHKPSSQHVLDSQ